jgi:hypothetical protein
MADPPAYKRSPALGTRPSTPKTFIESSPATAEPKWAALRMFFVWCQEEGEIPTSPVAAVKPPVVPEKVVEMLTFEGVGPVSRIRGGRSTRRCRRLWLSGKDGRVLSVNAVQRMMQRRGEDAGTKLHAHIPRPGFADAWLRAGGSEGDLMEIAGWQSRQTLGRYAAATRAERAAGGHRRLSPMARLRPRPRAAVGWRVPYCTVLHRATPCYTVLNGVRPCANLPIIETPG